MVPPLVHLLQPPLDDGRVFLASVHLAEDLPTGGRQRQEVLPLGVDLQLKILKKKKKRFIKVPLDYKAGHQGSIS